MLDWYEYSWRELRKDLLREADTRYLARRPFSSRQGGGPETRIPQARGGRGLCGWLRQLHVGQGIEGRGKH